MSTKSKAAKTAPAKKAAKTEKVVRVTKNEISRPRAGGNCSRIWEICDEITEKTGTPAVRKDVLERVQKANIPVATGQTQYNLWRHFNGLEGRLPSAKVKAEKVKLPKPPGKAKGKIGSTKTPKLPKPPAKKPAAPVAPVAPAAEPSAPAA